MLRKLAFVVLVALSLESSVTADRLRGKPTNDGRGLGDLIQSPLLSSSSEPTISGSVQGITASIPTEHDPPAQNRIVDGTDANQQDSSFFTMTLSGSGHFRGCGATLISNCHAVCAAHCGNIDGVMVGAHSFEPSEPLPQLIDPYHLTTVQETVINPAYDDRTNFGDLSILVFDDCMSEIEINDIPPALVPGPDFLYISNEPTTMFGFGRTSENDAKVNGKYVDVLQEVTVPFLSYEECTEYFGSQVKEDMVCAGLPQGGKDACIGDSGGPAIVYRGGIPVLVGATSWGVGCARPNYPGVYSSTKYHHDWIKDIVCNDPRTLVDSLPLCGGRSGFTADGNCLNGGEECLDYTGSECCSGVCESPRTGGLTRVCRDVSSSQFLEEDRNRGTGGRGGGGGGGGRGGAGGGRALAEGPATS